MTERLDALLFSACERSLAALALEDAQYTLSYGELAAAARKTAQALREKNLSADEPVLVPVANAPRDFAAFLGVWAAGGVVVPVARNAPAAATEATRAATGARLTIAEDGTAAILSSQPPPARPMSERRSHRHFHLGLDRRAQGRGAGS